MFGAHKETLMLAAIVVALVTCFYLFNEHKKTKTEIASFKTFMNTKPAAVAAAAPPLQAKPRPKPTARVSEPEPEPESED
jgi:hypothetical protein